jgi:hypothetical protein
VEVTTFKEQRGSKDLVEADIVLGGWWVQRWRVQSWGCCLLPAACCLPVHCHRSPAHHALADSCCPLPSPSPAAEKERQKGIIIGRGGTALKALGTAARAEVEEFLGRPVYLGLSVKVREGWRKDAEQCQRLGY